jgi:RNA polymerase sigma factor for flagellar operon FliA
MTSTPPNPRDDAARNERIMGCQGLVRSLAWQIHQRVKGRVDLNDLIGYGQIGLIEAANRYDDTEGARFITFAYQRIRGAILDGLAKMDWFRHADFYAGRYERVAGEVLRAGMEGAAGAGIHNVDDGARWLTDVGVRLSIVFLASAAADEGRASGLTLTDPAAKSPQSEMMFDELRSSVRELMSRLPEQGRQLLHWIYYDGLSLTAAAEKMAISKSWASRVHDKMLRLLATSLRDLGVESAATG